MDYREEDSAERFKANVIYHYPLVLIIVASVLLRLGSAFYLGDKVVPLPGTFDQVSYDMLARQVANGKGFCVTDTVDYWWPMTPGGHPTAHWSFLYVTFLAAIYKLFGFHPLAARIIQGVLAGIFTPWLTYLLSVRYYNRKVGLIAAALSAGYAYFVYYAASLMTEGLYIPAVLWSLFLVQKTGMMSNSSGDYQPSSIGCLLGLALAVAMLLRQAFLLLVPFFFAWLLWRSYRPRGRSVGDTIKIMTVALIFLAFAVAPWTIRNYRAFDRFVLLNTNAGFAFFWGNHPIHGYRFKSILPQTGPSYEELIPEESRHLNEADMERALLKKGLTFVRDDPLRYIVLSVSRIGDFFTFWPSKNSSLVSNISRISSFALLLPFMIHGMYLTLKNDGYANFILLYFFICIYTAIHLLTWALIRYRLPVDSVLIIFAASSLSQIHDRFHRRAGYLA